MFDWLNEKLNGETPAPWELLARLLAACLAGLLIAGLYRIARRGFAVPPSFPATLVMLAILVAVVTQVIGDHVARAFSLVGALSIVRFRTVVEDTYDIAFVIFAVVIGMAIGASQWPVAGGGLVVAGAAAYLLRPRIGPIAWSGRDSNLSVRVGIGADPDAVLGNTFLKHLESFRLIVGESGRQGAALDLTYKVRLRAKSEPTEFLNALNRLEGVQRVELRRE